MSIRPHWYAIQTKARCEDEAVGWLRRRTEVPVFLPLIESVRRVRGRKIRGVEALFPSYLFVQMSLDPVVWNAVRWTPGVRQIVGMDGVPVPVPDQAIELLRRRVVDGVVPWQPQLHSGSSVVITHGPFAGLIGILERPASRSERVRVLLQMMRTVVPIEVESVDLEETASTHQRTQAPNGRLHYGAQLAPIAD